MASKKDRVYNREVAEQSYPCNFTNSFEEIIQKDSPGATFGFTDDVLAMVCLDHDAVEVGRHGINDKTVDCSTIISSIDVNTLKLRNHRHLFIEFKLNCKAHNLKKEDYLGKIDHSLSLMPEYTTAITTTYPRYVFLFTNAVKGRALRDINGWSRGTGGNRLRNILIMEPIEFNEFIGFPHQFPYVPKNSRETIEQQFIKARNSKEECLEVVDRWYKRAVNYGATGLTLEQQHIAETVASILRSWIKESDEEDMEIEKEYLQEFENILVKIGEI